MFPMKYVKNKYPAIGIVRHRITTDGAGVTTLIASYGCTLRCAYCLNAQCFQQNTKIRYYTAEELIKTVSVDDLYFQATGGGVTFGGGEPLLQSELIREFGEKRPKEWKINLETALNVPGEMLERVLPHIDTFIIDIKDMNSEIYQRYTGQSNDPVLKNLEYLAAKISPERAKIRLPLIPGYNIMENVDNSEKILRAMGYIWFDRFTYRDTFEH